MADSRRVERVAALIRREVSEMLLHGIRDLRVIEGMVSITRVDVARDLQHCRIHVSVYGNEAERQTTLAGLRAASPYVKGELGRRLKLRRTPEVVFNLDRGLEEGSTVLGLLERLEAERLERAPLDPREVTGDPETADGPAPAAASSAGESGPTATAARHGGERGGVFPAVDPDAPAPDPSGLDPLASRPADAAGQSASEAVPGRSGAGPELRATAR